ncbi:CoA-binding protein [Maribacter sp. 2210JD10-5]|uniref:CoA-binding protein n=1 Tax=Maribacter sp. 2210JD10-5 TaxID=3386272 RepID=UPI0039BCB418
MKKTLVFGASLKPNRYSNIAINRLLDNEIPTVAYGLRSGKVRSVEIMTDLTDYKDLHTVTLYLNPKRQEEYYRAIIDLRPERVIFNPGTENPEFYELLRQHHVHVEVACTLVLLATGQY